VLESERQKQRSGVVAAVAARERQLFGMFRGLLARHGVGIPVGTSEEIISLDAKALNERGPK
jgi:hypothetical protein